MPRLQSLLWRQHVALDVGTATTRIAAGSSFVETPSRIGDKQGLIDGVVVDAETVLEILRPLLDRARVFGVMKPVVLACVPSDARADEQGLLAESIMKAGAASLSIIPEPLAAAIGAGLDVSSSYAHMVIDIGEGVTDCAITQSGRVQATCATRLGCAHMRRSIVKQARCNGWVQCDNSHAETLLRTCGLMRSPLQNGSVLVADALLAVLERIADTIESFLKDLPDRVGCDVIDSGISLTGGGALVPGVREYLEKRFRINMEVAPNPLASVAEGARAILPVMLSLNRVH